MRHLRIISTAVVAIIIAVALPIGGALYLAQRGGLETMQAQAMTLAESLLRHYEAASAQGWAALPVLTDPEIGPPCSPDSIASMRRLELSSSYLQAVAFIEDGRLRCSGSGMHGDDYPLPGKSFTTFRGVGITRGVSFPGIVGHQFILAQHLDSGFAVLFHGNLGFDLFEHIPDMAAGVVSRSTNDVIIHHGFLAEEWLEPRGTASRFHVMSGDHVVAMVESDRFDFGVYAALPAPRDSEQLLDAAIVFVPIGAVVASVLVLLVVVITRAQFSMPVALQLALKRNELFMEYEPVVNLQTRQWVGAEALIRWRRESGRITRPDMFIPIAEDTGMIQLVTERVFKLVTRDLAELARAGDRGQFNIAVNVSATDLGSEHTVKLVRALVAATSGTGLSVVVEATERGLVDKAQCRDIIDAIRETGAAIALDDFGTGYSSLSYIRAFDLDYLKIDRAFVETIGTDSPTSDVVRHIIDIARTMKLEVVAEGVETEAQAAYLVEHGVRLAQGWLFGKPMSVAALLARL